MGKFSKRVLSILLISTLLFSIAGCTKGKGKSSMGRYVEEIYENQEGAGGQGLTLLEKDKIVIYVEPEFKYAVVDTNGTLTNVDIDL